MHCFAAQINELSMGQLYNSDMEVWNLRSEYFWLEILQWHLGESFS